MNETQKILSDVTIFNKYAKYLPKQKRRETYSEICDRYEMMMIEKYPDLAGEILENMLLVRDKKVLPSMRAFQFAGPAIKKNNARLYNCCFLPIDDVKAFSEVMFLLLGGTGVGYSVQKHHVRSLPAIRRSYKSRKYLIGDSIEGWSDAIKVLMQSYFGNKPYPVFDYSDIRPKGQRLVTAGGKAPGPEPLKECIENLESILSTKKDGEQLTTLEVHDIICHIANSVLAGGIRRSALIALFSADDKSMMECKSGEWWVDNPQRGRSNNSAVLLRHRVKEDDFMKIWKQIEANKSGEPAVYFSNDREWGANPCVEISLRSFQFCNLTEVNGNVDSYEDFVERTRVATFFGTLQAGFTDFHYLRTIWKENTEKDALIGVSITGIANGRLDGYDKAAVAELVKAENARVAYLIGINEAARSCTVKPAGSTSCVLGVSSGIHAWYAKYYIRRSQIDKANPLYPYMLKSNPTLVQDYKAIPNSAVIELVQQCPDTGIVREEETALELLERIKDFNLNWVRAGHRSGANTNNVSATVSLRPDEWEEAGRWLWENREVYNGVAVLPYDSGTYVQAPFEEITKEEYERRLAESNPINLEDVLEDTDETEVAAEVACAGGACEISY